jgi:hypothetical protein
MAQWYAQVSGQRFGPVNEEEMKSWIAQGRVKPTDSVWSEGMPNWVTASAAFGQGGGASPASPPAQQTVYVSQAVGGALPAAPGAVTALVCGIIGVAVGCTGLVMGIIALINAKNARAAIAAHPGVYGGEGMATAGNVLGIIGVIWGGLIALYFIAAFTCMGSLAGLGAHGFH